MRTQHPLRENWYLREIDTEPPDIATLMEEAKAPAAPWLSAQMPTQVHEILLAHGRISDPHPGKNAADSAWVGERDWVYACRFAGPDRREGPVFLRFEGLDTLAFAYLNDMPVGQFDNMFREYVVDVRPYLAPPGQANTLLVLFQSPLRFVQAVRQPPEHQGKIARHKYFRKAANDFGTYLGARPHAVKVGIYRDIVLDVPDRAWIEDVRVQTDLAPDLDKATLKVSVTTAGAQADLEWRLIAPFGQEAAQGRMDTSHADFTIALDRPELWWPRTHGVPHLYRLEVRLLSAGECLDHREVPV